MYVVVFSVHVRMLIIQQLTICCFVLFCFVLFSIGKKKENNKHNKILNE